MLRTLLGIALRLAVVAGASWLMVRHDFAGGAVLVLSLGGVLVAKPLIDLASDLRHEVRRAAWHPVQGRHYAFQNRPVRVEEDADGRRWVRADDLRAAGGSDATDRTLAFTYGSGCRRIGGALHLGEDALLEHLGRSRTARAAAMREWARRDVVLPARNAREQRLGGSRTSAPEPDGADTAPGRG